MSIDIYVSAAVAYALCMRRNGYPFRTAKEICLTPKRYFNLLVASSNPFECDSIELKKQSRRLPASRCLAASLSPAGGLGSPEILRWTAASVGVPDMVRSGVRGGRSFHVAALALLYLNYIMTLRSS